MISMDKKYHTRDGRDVRVLCVDGPDEDYPVVGHEIGGDPDIMMWKMSGAFRLGQHSRCDLIEVQEKHVRWVVFFENDDCVASITREEKPATLPCTPHGRVLAIKKIEFEEGEGL